MRVLSVSELNREIKRRLEEDAFLLNVWVKGEVSDLRPGAAGHLYFTLRDGSACLRVVLFRSRAEGLTFPLANGAAVVIRGSISFYERDGTCRLHAAEVFRDGIGSIHADLVSLWQKLGREGLFDPARKKPLPRFPRSIGVVTSPYGAALRDILRVLKERWPAAEVVLAPVTVQGEVAPLEIAGAIRRLDRSGGVEVIIIGRGGGTAEELAPFNTEVVARAIHACRVPVVSAVGHETDRTIADLVADARAATPSHAAAMVVPDRTEITRYVLSWQAGLLSAMGRYLASRRQQVGAVLAGPVFADPVAALVSSRAEAVNLYGARLARAVAGLLRGKGRRVEDAAGRLDVLSPLRTLARGYSICTLAGTGTVVRDADRLKPGDRLNVIFRRGRAVCRVESKGCDESWPAFLTEEK